jgi:hypothetical protein
VKPVAKPPDPAALLKPKRIVGLTALGVASIEGDVEGDVCIRSGLDGAGDVIIGLNPGLSSSVAPSGIPPLPTAIATPPAIEGEVPDAVPAVGAVPQLAGELIAPELSPEGMASAHEVLLAVGSNGAGLSPLGDSEVAPNGIPTGPTGDVAPGIPSGDVSPIAGLFGEGGANCARLAPQPRTNIAEAVNKARNSASISMRRQVKHPRVTACSILRSCPGSCASRIRSRASATRCAPVHMLLSRPPAFLAQAATIGARSNKQASPPRLI